MNVIGLTGYAGAGKSTVANYLVERHGFTRLSFAAPLKKMLRTLDPVMGLPPVFWATDMGDFRLSNLWHYAEKTEVETDGEVKAEQWIKDSPWGDEYRRLLQVLGTDCIRAVDPDFWVNAAMAQMTDDNGKYVFDDVRFPNEAETILGFDNHYALWKIDAPGKHPANAHPSEQHSGKMGEQVWIMNSFNDFDYLHDQIDNAVEMAFGGVNA